MGLIAAETNAGPQDTEALYREHGAAVAALCRSLLRDRGDAEDATQQVFLSAHRALLNGAVPREPLAWLLAVTRNECYARFRQRAIAPVPTGDAPEVAAADASVHVLRAGELASMWDEVGQLPPAQREAFLLREIRGLSYGQLAAELSLSPPSVRSLLLRARSRLRQRLRDVAALGGTPWLQSLFRLVGGGGGGSPLGGATRAAAVGLGALALVSGGDVPRPTHLATSAPRHAAARQQPVGRERQVSSAASAAVAPEDRSAAGRASAPASTSDDRSGTDSSRSRDGRGSGSGSGSDDGSGDTTLVAQTTDGHDGGTSGSDGSRDGSTTSGPGPSSGSDGGSDSTTTVTITTSDTSGSGSGDSSSSGRDGGSIDGSGSSSGSDGGSSSTTDGG
jgi:RNA polymerase sigma-70 factor, ECF subfamily